MDYVALGRTGIRVSQLCFGTMSFGGDADRSESQRMFAACRDAGINFFDCANVYNEGLSEEILGGLMAAERDSLVITSKCVQETGPDTNDYGASRRHIMLSVEASLKRLRTDRLDVLFMHRWDEATDLEQTLRALDDLGRVRQGAPCRRLQLRRLAGRPGARHLRAPGLGAVRRAAAHVQPRQAPGRDRDPASGRGRGDRRHQLQPRRRRPAEREIPATVRAGCRPHRRQPDVRQALCRAVDGGDRRGLHRAGRRAGRAPGQPGRRLGRRASGNHLPDHRRPQRRAVAPVAGLRRRRHDAGLARRSGRPVPHAPHRPPIAWKSRSDPAAGPPPAARSALRRHPRRRIRGGNREISPPCNSICS